MDLYLVYYMRQSSLQECTIAFIAVETTLIADATKTGGSFISNRKNYKYCTGGAALAAFFIIKQNKN